MHWSYKTFPELAHLPMPARKAAFQAAAKRVPRSWLVKTLLLVFLPIMLPLMLLGPELGLNRIVSAAIAGGIAGGVFGTLQLKRVRRVLQEEGVPSEDEVAAEPE